MSKFASVLGLFARVDVLTRTNLYKLDEHDRIVLERRQRAAAPHPGGERRDGVGRLEGAGEVQTPLVGANAATLSIGDLVWFRHAKSGELAEHTASVHLLAGPRIRESVPTYRGMGHAW